MSLLSPLGWMYGKIAAIRNAFYDSAALASYSLGALTISVGNLTTGGTGKTPLVRLVAEILATGGEKVCILTRGYGRRNETKRVLVSDWNEVIADAAAAGDEPVELANRLLGKAIVLADADRVAAARWAREKFGITAFVLDDAFQHRRAERDLDVVCIDATDPFGDEEPLPAGRLREPLTGLARADVVVITRAELVHDVTAIEKRVRTFNSKAKFFRGFTRLSCFVSLDSLSRVDWDHSESAFAFAGIGNSTAFFSLIRNENLNLAGSRAFRDHYKYRQVDIARLEAEARRSGASVLVTTAKDSVKLSQLQFKLPCVAAVIDIEIDDGEEFEKSITSFS